MDSPVAGRLRQHGLEGDRPRPRYGSSARKTTPMPPAPSTESTRYGPSRPISSGCCGGARRPAGRPPRRTSEGSAGPRAGGEADRAVGRWRGRGVADEGAGVGGRRGGGGGDGRPAAGALALAAGLGVLDLERLAATGAREGDHHGVSDGSRGGISTTVVRSRPIGRERASARPRRPSGQNFGNLIVAPTSAGTYNRRSTNAPAGFLPEVVAVAFSLVRSLVKHSLKGIDSLTGGLVPVGSIAAGVYVDWCTGNSDASAEGPSPPRPPPPPAAQATVLAQLEAVARDVVGFRKEVDALLASLASGARTTPAASWPTTCTNSPAKSSGQCAGRKTRPARPPRPTSPSSGPTTSSSSCPAACRASRPATGRSPAPIWSWTNSSASAASAKFGGPSTRTGRSCRRSP